MKIKISEDQLKRLTEKVNSDEVICECGWSWRIDEGGSDPFVCHKCGKNNE